MTLALLSIALALAVLGGRPVEAAIIAALMLPTLVILVAWVYLAWHKSDRA
jgi:hypothetical protein